MIEMMLHEGSRVVYAGDDPAVGVGSEGKILSHEGGYSHVQWTTGSRTGTVDPIPHEELLPHRVSRVSLEVPASAGFEDSLDHQRLVTFAVRETYDDFGEDGVLNALSETGTLASLASLADEAIGTIGQRLRTDPVFNLVLAQLDDSEADSLMVRVAVHLLQSQED